MNFIRNLRTQSILAADVRASSAVSVDFATRAWNGLALFRLDAEAQGSGKTLAVALQESAAPAAGAGYDEETSLGDTQLRSGASTNIKLGQQFTQDGARQVKSIKLRLKQRGTIAAEKVVTASLYTDDTDAPNALLGTSAEVLCSSIDDAYAWVEFTFATPVDLADATPYWVVLEGDYTESGANNIAWETDTVAEGGLYAHYTTSWQSITTTKNLLFQAYEYNFAAITGGTFTTVGNAAATEDITLNADNLKAYIRASTTATGSNAGATCLTMVGTQKYPA